MSLPVRGVDGGRPVPKPKPPRTVTPPPQPPNRSPGPGVNNDVDRYNQISHAPVPTAPSPVTPTQVSLPTPKPKRRPSYLQSHPLIAQQIKDAQQSMNAFDLSALLTDIVREKYYNENAALESRLNRKENRLRDYYTDAQIAEREGDLDYTQDNPIDPRLLKYPDLHGAKSPSGLRRQMLGALGATDDPAQESAIRRLIEGNGYGGGLLDISGQRQNTIRNYKQSLADVTHYHEDSLEKTAAYIDQQNKKIAADNEKYKDKPEWQKPFITDPHEPQNLVADPENFLKNLQAYATYKKAVKAGFAVPEHDDNPLNVLGGSDTPTIDQREAAMVTSPFYEQSRKNQADPSQSGYNKYVQAPVGSVLYSAMDKVSRPLYGVTGALDYMYASDDSADVHRNTLLGKWLGNDLPDKMSVGDILGTAKAGWKGFTGSESGNPLGLVENADDPKFTGEIIKRNAEKDTDDNIYDHGWYQNVAGLAGDIVADPLTYATFGVGSVAKGTAAGARGIRSASDVNAAKEFYAGSNEIDDLVTKYMKDTGIDPELAESKIVRDIITGHDIIRGGQFPRTVGDKVQKVNRVEEALNTLDDAGTQQLRTTKALKDANRQRLIELVDEYKERRKLVLDDAGMQTVRSQLEGFVEQQVRNGVLPSTAIDRYSPDRLLNTRMLESKMEDINSHVNYYSKLAEEMGITRTQWDHNAFGTAQNEYIKKLESERDQFSSRIVGTSSKAEAKQLAEMDSQIARVHERMVEERGGSEKGNFTDFMEAHAKAMSDEDPEFAARMAAAQERLEAQGITDPGTDLKDLLGKDIFNDPRFTSSDIYRALQQSRGFAFGDPTMKKQFGAVLKDLNGRLKDQEIRLNQALKDSNRDEKLVEGLRDGIAGLRRSIEGFNRTRNQAQATRFLHNIEGIVERSGQGNMAQTDRAFALSRVKLQIQGRLKKADMSERVQNFKEPIRDFLDENNQTLDAVFEGNPGHQELEQMLAEVKRQLKQERNNYWESVADDIDLNSMPPMYSSADGKINREALKKDLKLNPYTGVWSRKADYSGVSGHNEWLDDMADVLTRDYQSVRHQIANRKKQGRRNIVIDQAKEDWDALKSQNIEEIAPMFAKRDGSALTEAELSRTIDEDTPLFPYVRDPETNEVLLLGTAKANKRILELHPAPKGTPKDAEHIHAEAAGRKMFEEEHGITLGEARDMKERALGQTLLHWNDEYGHLTQRDFISKALDSFESFRDIMLGGPFKLTVGGVSEKQARKGASVLSAEGKKLSEAWAKNAWHKLKTMPEGKAERTLQDVFKASRGRAKKSLAEQKKQFIESRVQKATHEGELKSPRNEARLTTREAADKVFDVLDDSLSKGRLIRRGFNKQIELKSEINIGSPDADLLNYAKKNMTQDKWDQIRQMRKQAARSSGSERARLTAGIKQAQREIKLINKQYETMAKEVQKAKAAYDNELRVEALIRAARMPLARNDKVLRMGIMGKEFSVPGSKQFFAAVEKASGVPLERKTRLLWAKSFGTPSKQIPIDAVTARARAQGMTPHIIKRETQTLTEQFGDIRPSDLSAGWEKARVGMWTNTPAADAIRQGFTDIVPYFQKKYMAETGRPLSVSDINAYLKPAFRIDEARVNFGGINDADDLIQAITHRKLKDGTIEKRTEKELNNPYEILWNLRVGINVAAGRRALEHTLSETFGIARKPKGHPSHDVIEELSSKHQWQAIPRLDQGTHLYPPEIVDDLQRMLDMTSPRNITPLGDFIDQANGIWKASVTIYNPGYWTRNTVGEIMSSWLGGVNTVTPYKRAAKLIRFGAKEGDALEALHSQFPLLKNAEIGDKAPNGSDVLFQMRNGEKITVERALVSMHDQGLMSTFFNTEYRHQRGTTSGLTSLPGLKQIAHGHRGLRKAGEHHEDWLRTAHYLDVLAKSKKPFNEAIKDAAAAVRKYHFDYSDFSPFEKTVMLRAFPFYKWTRKAFPLMASMMFMRPGKFMAFPKTMNAVSSALTSQDITEDKNGFLPNFTGIVPNWVMNLMPYQVSSNNDASSTAFRLATPQFDALQMANSSTGVFGQAYTLANPYAKTIAEELAGKTFSDQWWAGGEPGDQPGEIKIDLNNPDYTDQRLKHIMRNIGGPWGNFAQKGIGETPYGPNEVSRNDLISQLTGLGFYDIYPENVPSDLLSNTDSNSAPPVESERIKKLLREQRSLTHGSGK